jgi:hypothetical protein
MKWRCMYSWSRMRLGHDWLILLIVSGFSRFPSLDPRPLGPKDAFPHLTLASLAGRLQLTTIRPGVKDALGFPLPAIDAGFVRALEVVRVGPLLRAIRPILCSAAIEVVLHFSSFVWL